MPETVTPKRNLSPVRQLVCLAAIVATAAVIVVWVRNRPEELPPGVTQNDYERAAGKYRARYQKQPSRMDVLSYLGELSLAEDDPELAANCFRAIPITDDQYGLSARLQLGQILIKLNRAPEAEEALREFLANVEQSSDVPEAEMAVALQWLTYLMSVELRLDERVVFLKRLHELDKANPYESVQYYFPHLLLWRTVKGRERLHRFLEQNPEDTRLLIAEGRYLTWEGNLTEARQHLEELAGRIPDDLDCLAALLECHFERNDWDSFRQVLQRVPPESRKEPWLLSLMRGEFALHRENWKEAAIQFEKLLAEEPAHVTACLRLSQAYRQLGEHEKSQFFQQRTRILAQIRPKLTEVTTPTPPACEELAEQCERLGFQEAADVFRTHAERLRRLNPGMTTNTAETDVE